MGDNMKSNTLICITWTFVLGALAVPVQLPAQNQVRYTVTDLGTLGGTFSQAFSINNNGSVVGFATLPGDTALHAFLWRNGVMTDLGTLGGPLSQATHVNDRDEVVGFSETSAPDPLGEDFCGFGDHLVCLPFVWRAGVMTPLPTLGGTNGIALSINSRGEVLGNSENSIADPTCVPPQVLQFKPVVWHKMQIEELPTFPGDPDGGVGAINDAGEATLPTGNCVSLGPPIGHDSLLRHGTLTDFGSFEGVGIDANDINNKGQVVGVTFTGVVEVQAVLWRNGVASGLGFLPGDVVSIGSAISDTGQIVGQSVDSNGNTRGFVWRDGVMSALETLIPADSTLDPFDPGGVNSRGQIVGLAVVKGTCVPAPPTVSCMPSC
jgi:probable HAF family extracellular repeat protein